MARTTVYDHAGKSLIRMIPYPTIVWLLGIRPETARFQGWENIEISGLHDEDDHRADLIAVLERLDFLMALWLVNIELQTDATADIFNRLEKYANLIEKLIRPGNNRGDECNVGSILVNFRGISVQPPPQEWTEAGLCRKHDVKIINLCELDADRILTDVTGNQAPMNILGWLPLMQNGNEPSIIQRWLDFVNSVHNEQRRIDLAALVKIFAEAASQGQTWGNALKGFNIMKSAIYEEWTTNAVREDREEQRRKSVRIQHDKIIKMGRDRFGDSPKHIREVESIDDDQRLLDILADSYKAHSWDELLGLS